MPQREPRSPEPRGTHAFGGALLSNRLNPPSKYTHPDPFTIGSLTVSTALTTNGTFTANGTNILTGLTSSAAVQINSTLGVTGTTTLAGVSAGAVGVSSLASTGAVSGTFVTATSGLTTNTVSPVGTPDIGGSGSRFGTIYSNSLNATTVYATTLDDISGGSIALATNISISGALALAIGSASTNDQLNSLHVNTATIYTKITLDSGADIIPSSTTTASNGTLGDATHKFLTGYIDRVELTTLAGFSSASITVADDLTTQTVRPVSTTGGDTLGDATHYYDTAYVRELDGAGADVVLADDLDIDYGVRIDFNGHSDDLAASAGASQGYIRIKVGGVSRLIEYFAV